MRRFIPLILALCLLPASPAAGEVYRWTDSQGRVHFSQDLGQVPPGQRAAAREAAQRPSLDRLQRFGAGSAPAARAAHSSHSRASTGRRGRLSIPFERHNHLMVVQVRLNDRVTAPFLVDTGASLITIPNALAAQLGIRVGPDTPRERFSTANGDIWEPIVDLESVQAGGARVENLKASLSSSMDIGLLGGNFFNNFVYRVDAASGRIELEVNPGVRGGISQEDWKARFRELRQTVQRIDRYLAQNQLTSERRVAELHGRRRELAERLSGLESEANAAGVPRGWRY